MALGFVIRQNEYYDSVFLMRIAKTLDDEPGVKQSAALMATEANKKLLAEIGFKNRSIDQATPNDLIVAIIADNQILVDRLIANLDSCLHTLSGPGKSSRYRFIDDALLAHPNTNLVVISVPGSFAGRETRKALDQGKHVFLFSNNVPLEHEVELKQIARNKHLLLMGPDCGTSIINGIGIGFANVIRRGPIGVVGPSGTGIQEFTSLVHQAGSGISHAIGTGSRDLSDAVGGITTLLGIDALESDPMTKVIAIISKPAQQKTYQSIIESISMCKKPVISCFLGMDRPIAGVGDHFTQAYNIDEAMQLALQKVGFISAAYPKREDEIQQLIRQESSQWHPEQRYLRGLFAGGTFCYQSQQIMREAGINVYSNNPIDKHFSIINPELSQAHSMIDMGDDYFTQGKPHPMIDSTERRKRLLVEAADREVAVVQLDFILGYIASPDPVGDMVEAIQEAKSAATRHGSHLTIVASICGTDQDPQNLFQQKHMLEQSGVLVFPSNVRAARFCAKLLLAAKGENHGG